jgi:hypothetical protein
MSGIFKEYRSIELPKISYIELKILHLNEVKEFDSSIALRVSDSLA